MGTIALAVVATAALGACSSDGDGAGPAPTVPGEPATTATGVADGAAAETGAGGETTSTTVVAGGPAAPTTAGAGGDPAGPPTTDLAGYYEGIGVAPDVAGCYARQLETLGITEVGLLETDPEKSAAAAGLFDACIADPSGPATSSP